MENGWLLAKSAMTIFHFLLSRNAHGQAVDVLEKISGAARTPDVELRVGVGIETQVERLLVEAGVEVVDTLEVAAVEPFGQA